MKTRKSYSKEFKLDAIALVREQNYSIAEAARNLELTPQLLGRWIKKSESGVGWLESTKWTQRPMVLQLRELNSSALWKQPTSSYPLAPKSLSVNHYLSILY
ncbi:transposase [Shewanella baltica]|jgi:transposase-like protein|uniref:transposase n=1 Tax=Shewanella baltica TaxID=62322 RepID=UPI003D7A1DFA